MKKQITLIIILCAMTYTVMSSPVDMMIGARGYGMGGAYVAVADDPSAAYWNPSRLSYVERMSIMDCNWILQDVEGMNVNYVNVAVPIKYAGTIAGSWLLNHATLEHGELDSDGNVSMVSNPANEHTFSLSLGRKLWDELLILRNTSLGFSINRYAFNTEEENGAGLGFDLGISTEFPYGFSIGFTARTLGAEVMGYKIDPEFRLGIGYTTTINEMHRISVGVDGTNKLNRDYESIATLEPARVNIKGFGGIEYALLFDEQNIEIAVRGGGNGMALHNTLKNYTFTGGAGFKWLGYSVQYAFVGATDRDAALGYGHRIALTIQLDKLYPGQKKLFKETAQKEE
ncbi:MAG: PorV/PorQ family protein [Chitinivibrionales bacterium]|nr:PorV/PorQ family protein [Chitinivibrionales bacterium]